MFDPWENRDPQMNLLSWKIESFTGYMQMAIDSRKHRTMKSLDWLRSPPAAVNFGLILIFLILNGVVIHRNTSSLRESQSWVVHTHEVLTQIERLFEHVVVAESAARGYAITGDDIYLHSHRHAVRTLPEIQQALQFGVRDNPVQSARVQELQQHIAARLDHLNRVIDARRENGISGAADVVGTGLGKETMEHVRQAVDSLKFEEKNLLSQRAADSTRQLHTILIANAIGGLLVLTICGLAWWLTDVQVRKCRAAEAHAESERENLLVTLTSIGDAVVVTDPQGRITLSNHVADELLGQPPNLIGRRLQDVFQTINESTRLPVDNPVTKAIEVGKVVQLANHTLLVTPDGKEIPIEDTAAPIRMKSGEITGVVLVFRDCSTRWQFERKLRNREERYRRLFETPLIGIAVGTSAGSHLLEANDAYLELIGYDRGELPDNSLSWGGVESSKSPLVPSAVRELQETGVCRPFEQTCVRSDGVNVPVLISATKLNDDEDRVIVFVTDLSTIKRSEAALRDSENRFRILSESMPQMVWTALPDGQFNYVNRTLIEYSGLSADKLTGWGWTELLNDDDRQKHVETWRSALSTGQRLELEHRLRQRTGEYRWHLTRALPMLNSDQQIILWVGTDTDIHDHKRTEALLLEEHQRKDQFLALLAHELRNPLAPLANAVQVLPAVLHDSAGAMELVGIMQRQVRQMVRLIDDLLDLARITQGRILLRRERILASTVTAAAVESVQPLINEREHELIVTLPGHDVWIDADAARLSQMLTNLLNNAAKYTEPHGRIELIVELAGSEILFRVRDNGAGLSEAMVSRIFDLFMQVEQTLNRSHGGLGIGLTLARTLAELHGGRITAHSAGIGLGSEFVVTLPICIQSFPAPEPSWRDSNDGLAPIPRLHVMVVDDVQASARTLAMMLAVLDQNVEIALDGPDAISRVTDGTFNVVFLDIAMPGMDGLEVARKLRANPDLNRVILVALTGFGQDEDRQRSVAAGFDEHLIKPTSIALLREVLLRAVSRWQK